VILLDTHVWRWWVDGGARLSVAQRQAIAAAGPGNLGVSIISCWEVAKAVESGTLVLTLPVADWMDKAVQFPDIVLLPLTPQIAVASTQLKKPIHRDPGDQMIIATANALGVPLLTDDAKILAYRHVQTIG
jgi:PIN domain nuclease of toxin-antitoxin system